MLGKGRVGIRLSPAPMQGAFISNPERLRTGAPLAKNNRATWYGGGAKGYTDFLTR